MRIYFRIIPAVLVLAASAAMGEELSSKGVAIEGAGHGAAAHGAAARQMARNQLTRQQGVAPSPTHTAQDGDLADQQAQYDFQRTAPAGFVSGQALVSAAQQAAALPTKIGRAHV